MISPTFSTLFVFASLALLVAIPATLILALLGLKQSIRHGRFWRYGLPACMAFVLLQLMLFFNSHAIDSAWSDAERWYYTRHLRSATVYDNMHFPARSTVVLSPRYSHEVIGGAVPVDTPLLGLTVQGDFSIRTTGEDKPTTYLSEGVLAQPASIRGVPCAAGAFTHSIEPESWKDEVNCTLASNYAIRNLELPAGTNAIITFDTVRPPDVHVIGYALHDWSWLGVRCAKGGFRYYGDLTCTLAVTQSVAGYPLAVGQEAVVYDAPGGEVGVGKGVLANDIDVGGAHIPAGSIVKATYDRDAINADRLRSHDMDEGEYVQFDLPAGARLEAAGSILRGDSVGLFIGARTIRVHVVDDSAQPLIIRDGTFDMTSHTWQWEPSLPDT